MVKVKAKYYGVVKDIIKAPTAEFELPDDATMGDLLAAMAQRYGREFAQRVLDDRIGVRSYVKLFLNDEEIEGSAIGTTRLGIGGPDAEATLFIMPSSTGGSRLPTICPQGTRKAPACSRRLHACAPLPATGILRLQVDTLDRRNRTQPAPS